MFGLKRPDNWYDMSYDQQRTWERNERKHRDELDDAERREQSARKEADDAQRRLERARREHRAYAVELSEENERLGEEVAAMREQRAELLEACRLFTDAAHETRDVLNGHGFACPASIAVAAEKARNAIAKVEGDQ